MRIIPRVFYASEDVHCLVQAGQSAVFAKSRRQSTAEDEIFLSASSFSIVVRGEKRLTGYSGELSILRAGETVFMPRDLYLIADLTPAGGVFESYVFFFDDALIEQFLANHPLRRPSAAPPGALYRGEYGPALQTFVKQLGPLFQNLGGSERERETLLRIKLLELLQLIQLTDAPATGASGAFADWLFRADRKPPRELRAFLERHYDRALTIEDYAALTGRSASTFLRDFKREFGCAPGQWLRDRRLEKARRLLEEQNLSVTEAALEIGYENVSHFIRAFKRRFSISPKQYLLQRRLRA